MADGIANQGSNPEVDVDIRKPNSLIEQQTLQLKIITEKLKKAFGGHDVDYYDIRGIFKSRVANPWHSQGSRIWEVGATKVSADHFTITLTPTDKIFIGFEQPVYAPRIPYDYANKYVIFNQKILFILLL